MVVSVVLEAIWCDDDDGGITVDVDGIGDRDGR